MDYHKESECLINEEEIDPEGSYFKNIFNKLFLSNSLNLINRKRGDLNEKSLKIIKEDPIFKIIEDLYNLNTEAHHLFLGAKNDTQREKEEKKLTNDISSIKSKDIIQIYMNPPPETSTQEDFEYTKKMEIVLVDKFKEFGVFKDFESLIKNADRLYQRDEISKFHKLIVNDESKKLKDLVLNKKDQFFINKFNLEAKIITEVDYEIDHEIKKNYNSVLLEDNLKIWVNCLEEKELKIIFEKVFHIKHFERLLTLFNEVKFYPEWIPALEDCRTLNYIKHSQKCIYAKFNLPIIQDRDMLLYCFVNNKIRDKIKSFQFLSKSFDDEEIFKHFDTIKKNDDAVRINLNMSSFEIKILDNQSILLQGFINVNPKLFHLQKNYINILSRQYIKKYCSNIEKIIDDENFNEIFKKSMSVDSKEFYRFIENEMKLINIKFHE